MQKKPWTTETVKEMPLGLSDSVPIMALHNQYDKVHGLSNDMHYSLELGIVLNGKMRRYYQNHQIDIKTGDIWFCGMWEPHGFEVLKAPCEVIVFTALPQHLIKIHLDESNRSNWLRPFAVPPDKRPKINPQNKNDVVAIAKKTKDLLKSNDHQQQIWLRLLLLETLLIVQRRWNAPIDHEKTTLDTLAGINPALQKIFQEQQCLSMNEAASLCGMSRSSFTKHFKTMMGISFAKFELRYRIKGAANQLANSTEPVKKIAYDWGFTDSSHLHRCFLEHYRCTPTQYRKKLSK